MTKNYLELMEHYESCLAKHGDNHRGVDWPNLEDVYTRYRAMIELIREEDKGRQIELLDFGCGASHLYQYLQQSQIISDLRYFGADISKAFIDLSQKKYPNNKYFCIDLLENEISLPAWDYCIANGVFTEKRSLSSEDMFDFMNRVLVKLFSKTRKGIAFNVMSPLVDWTRDDLFYVPFDKMATFLAKNLSRNFVFRNDYGLYEYTVYIYRTSSVGD